MKLKRTLIFVIASLLVLTLCAPVWGAGIRVGSPKVQIWDNNGAPAVGWKIYTYVPGSSTPKATYSNVTLSAANTNPIVLDARGEAIVYLSSATKMVLTTPSGTPASPVWSMDSVGAEYGSLPVNALDYGVVADGNVSTGAGTDNTTALNNALASNAVVYLPKGVYKVAGGIHLVGNQVFFGDGQGETVIFASRASTTDSFNLITNLNYINGDSTNQSCVIRGMSLYVNGATLTDVSMSHNSAGNGIALDYANGSIIEDVYVQDAALNSIFVADTDDLLVSHCRVKDSGRLSYVNQTDPNWTVKASANGITVVGSGAIVGKQVLVTDCEVDTFRDAGINSWLVDNVVFRDCTVIGTIYSGVTSLNGNGGFSAEGDPNYCTFINCRHLDCSSSGFYLTGIGHVATDCFVLGKSTGATIGFKVNGSDIVLNNPKVRGAGTIDNAIVVTSDAIGSYVTGNKIYNPDIKGATVAINLQNAKEFAIVGGTLHCDSVAASNGIVVNAYPGDVAYTSNSVIKGVMVKLAASDAFYLLWTDYLLLEDNIVLGAANSAFRIDNCDYINIRKNLVRKYDGTHTVGLAVQFENNPIAAQILNNEFADYDNSSGNYPYGMLLSTTGTPALVQHSNTGVAQETINGKLGALAGSMIWTRNAGGNGVELAINTDSASTWTSAAPY